MGDSKHIRIDTSLNLVCETKCLNDCVAQSNRTLPDWTCKILPKVKLLGQILGGKIYTISPLPFRRGGGNVPLFPPLPTPMLFNVCRY